MSGHMVKDCPNVRTKDKGSSQAQASGPSSDAPKRKHFYTLHCRGE